MTLVADRPRGRVLEANNLNQRHINPERFVTLITVDDVYEASVTQSGVALEDEGHRLLGGA